MELIAPVRNLMARGEPYVSPRGLSDYWSYATFFSSSCPVAMVGDTVVGAAIAFRSQDDPGDLYIQEVMTHPDHRRRGIARALLDQVGTRGLQWGCTRLFLTSLPHNVTAHRTWTALGFVNVPGDHALGAVSVITDFKGPGRSRAVFERPLG